jgi:SOS-response transcriptional repressor LexA
MAIDLRGLRLERLAVVRDTTFGGNARELAAAIKRSPSQLSQWFTGVRTITEGSARHIENALGLSAGWLDTPESAPTRLSEPPPPPFDVNVEPATGIARAVPIVDWVQAGQLREMVDPYPPGAGDGVEYVDSSYGRYAVALRIKGDSMAPEFREGDVIIVDPAIVPSPGDFVVVRNGSHEATFKKFRPRGIDASGREVFELVPLNDDYPTMRSDTEPLLIVGTMVEHRKRRRR